MKKYLKTIVLVITYFIIMLILFWIGDLIYDSEKITVYSLSLDVVIQIATVACVYFLYKKINFVYMYTPMDKSKIGFKEVLIIISLTISVFIISELIVSSFIHSEDIEGHYSNIEVYYQLLTTILIAPICEEVILEE